MNDMESAKGEIVMYQPDETIRLEVRVENETVWLNRQQIASLFSRDVKTIGKHINNALKEELANIPTVAKFAIVRFLRAIIPTTYRGNLLRRTNLRCLCPDHQPHQTGTEMLAKNSSPSFACRKPLPQQSWGCSDSRTTLFFPPQRYTDFPMLPKKSSKRFGGFWKKAYLCSRIIV